jgi:hypothetical protein
VLFHLWRTTSGARVESPVTALVQVVRTALKVGWKGPYGRSTLVERALIKQC